MKKYVKYLACALLLILVGCYGEKKNDFSTVERYQYTGAEVLINGVVKENADTSDMFGSAKYVKNIIVVNANDKIDIKINSTVDDGYVPSYKWELMETTQLKDPITGEFLPPKQLGNTKDVSFNINGSPVEYSVVCTIANEKNGTQDFIGFIFKINKPNGLAIIYETEHGGDFDFLKTSKNTLNLTKNEYYPSVYFNANNSYIKEPYSFHFVAGAFGAPNVEVLINRTSFTAVDLKTYKVKSVDQHEFFSFEPPVYSKSSVGNSGSSFYGIFDDQIYYCNLGFKFKNQIDPKNKYMPLVIGNTGSTTGNAYFIFFDAVKKAFKYGNSGGGVNTFVTRAGSKFDVNDTKMDLIFAESGYDKCVNAIMKSGSTLYFSVMDLKYGLEVNSVKQEDVSVLSMNDITALQGMSDKSLWSMNVRSDKAFYSSGSNVYIYDQRFNTSKIFTTGLQGNITMLKVFIHANDALNSKTLYVGTDAGKLYEFSFDINTNEKIGEPAIFDIPGKPINIKYN